MALLIAVAGWSGSGKTTAIDHLSKIGAGEKIYIGEAVLDEIHARGMAPGPVSEQLVRLNLREQHGRGALALRAIPSVKEHLDLIFPEADNGWCGFIF
jgi:dephospho-CoA kinase